MVSMNNNKKAKSKILELIKELEDFVEKSKPSALSNSKIVVSKEELLSIIRELRMKTPDEIERYSRMLDNRDAIIADAEKKAEKIIEEARYNVQNLIDEHEIVQQALEEADRIMADATNQANELMYQTQRETDMMKRSTVRYMVENLTKLQNLIDSTMNSFDNRFKGMMSTLDKYSALVKENKDELLGRNEEPQPEEEVAAADAQEESFEMEYNEQQQVEVQVSDSDFE